MTRELYGWCILLFFIGQAATLFLVDIPEHKKLAKTANHDWSWAEWWSKDWNMIIGTQLIGIIVFIVLDEILHFRPGIIDMIKGFFATFGIIASLLASKFGSYRKMVMKIMDRKTNYADGKTAEVIQPDQHE